VSSSIATRGAARIGGAPDRRCVEASSDDSRSPKEADIRHVVVSKMVAYRLEPHDHWLLRYFAPPDACSSADLIAPVMIEPMP
jgi:hypothetical protein